MVVRALHRAILHELEGAGLANVFTPLIKSSELFETAGLGGC